MDWFKILLIFILPSLAYSQEQPKSFEGVITYLVEVEYPERYEYEWYITQKYGDTMQLYISEKGDYLMKYLNSGNMGLDFHSYSQSKNTGYAKWKNLDTIRWGSSADTIIDFKSIKAGNDTTVLRQNCRSIIVNSNFAPEGLDLQMTYYYSGTPFINPGLYKNHYDSFYYLIYPITSSPYLMLITDYKDFIVTYTAIEIKKQKIESNVFDLPAGYPLAPF